MESSPSVVAKYNRPGQKYGYALLRTLVPATIARIGTNGKRMPLIWNSLAGEGKLVNCDPKY